MMAAIFVHPELVVEPGWGQIGAALLVGTATLGITFSLQASFADRRTVDWAARLALAAVALAVLLTPNYPIAIALAVPVLGAIIYWLVVRRRSLGSLGAAVTEIDTAGLAASVSSEFGNVS